jgi:exosortase E/protease (VPEID-CTERM system)
MLQQELYFRQAWQALIKQGSLVFYAFLVSVICVVYYGCGFGTDVSFTTQWHGVTELIHWNHLGNRRHLYRWGLVFCTLLLVSSSSSELRASWPSQQKSHRLLIVISFGTLVFCASLYALRYELFSYFTRFLLFRSGSWLLIFGCAHLLLKFSNGTTNLIGLLHRCWLITLVLQIGEVFAGSYYEYAAPLILGSVRYLLVDILQVSAVVSYDLGLSTLSVGDFSAAIASPCAGSEGIAFVLTLFLGLRALGYMPGSWGRTLLSIMLLILMSWSLNVTRIATLFMVGHEIDPQLALNGFHSHLGWLMNFGAVATVLYLSTKKTSSEGSFSNWLKWIIQSAAGRYMGPVMIFGLSGMVIGLFSAGELRAGYRHSLQMIFGLMALGGILYFYRARLSRLNHGGSFVMTGVLVGVGCYLLWMLGGFLLYQDHQGHRLDSDFSFFLWMLGSSLAVPVFEELAFRGYLMRRISFGSWFERFEYRRVRWFGLAASSGVFALGHDKVLAAFIVGICLGYLVIRSNRLWPAIVAHGVTNLLIAITVYQTGAWFLV